MAPPSAAKLLLAEADSKINQLSRYNLTELTHKLLRSLDSNYNVIDMPAVVEVISIFENISFTVNYLKESGLGKHVNLLRKSTTDSALARRAKGLVKRWRDLVYTAPLNHGQISRKRAAPPESYDSGLVKRARMMNGQTNENDLTENSNSSFSDVGLSRISMQRPNIVNSDSNLSIPAEYFETFFSSKLNVSRGNAKVETIQELLADLHIQTVNNLSNSKPQIEDQNDRAAKLTERVSKNDRKLNTNSTRYNRWLSYKLNLDKSVHSIKYEVDDKNDDVRIVDEPDVEGAEVKVDDEVPVKEEVVTSNIPKSLSVREALLLLPPIDKSVLLEEDPEPKCSCQLIEKEVENVTETGDVIVSHSYEFIEDETCLARDYLIEKYKLGDQGLNERVKKLHEEYLPNLNGNYGAGCCTKKTQMGDDGLYLNVVPKFSEWHEVLETPSYNGEILKILPYVIID